MKKTKKQVGTIVIGTVFTDLCVWVFDANQDVVRHNANEMARAMHLIYGMQNFNPTSFGIPDEEE